MDAARYKILILDGDGGLGKRGARATLSKKNQTGEYAGWYAVEVTLYLSNPSPRTIRNAALALIPEERFDLCAYSTDGVAGELVQAIQAVAAPVTNPDLADPV